MDELSSEQVSDSDCIVLTPPSSEEESPLHEIAASVSDGFEQPIIAIAPSEQVDFERLLNRDIHYIPYIGENQTYRLVASEVSLVSGAVEQIDPDAEWRVSPTSMSHISQAISEAFSVSFEAATQFALTLAAAHLGYETGHATMTTGEGINLIADREAYAYNGEKNYTDLPTNDLVGEVYSRRRGVLVSEADIPDEDISELGITTTVDGNGSTFEVQVEKDPIYVNTLTPPAGVGSYIGIPVEHDREIVGELSLASENEYSLQRLQHHINHLRAVVQLVESIYSEMQVRENLQQQVDHLENFSQIVAHDLQNPVNIVDGRLKILNEGLGIENEHIDEARMAVDRIEDIIDDILQYAKNGGVVQETTKINIPAVVSDCWELVGSDCAVIDVVDRFNIEGDIGRVNHLFENLLSNAVTHTDATEDNPVHIRVGMTNILPTTTRSDFSGLLGFYVEDDGPGIPPEKREELLELGETTSETGTGMGLAIVDEVATAHGWEMEITESHSGGTRFEFSNVLGSKAKEKEDQSETQSPPIEW